MMEKILTIIEILAVFFIIVGGKFLKYQEK
jgi:hypothetical protein